MKSIKRKKSSLLNIKLSMKQLEKKYKKTLPLLNEKQKRLMVASDVINLKIKITVASKVSGISRKTIYKGIRELETNPIITKRIRKAGGGRKEIKELNNKIYSEIESLVEPYTIGDPISPLRWTTKSLRKLSDTLLQKGIKVSHQTVGKVLKEIGYSLQSNFKRYEGKNHPDRDLQFNYINNTVKQFLETHNPVISVDAKKKELIGNYKNNGKEICKKNKPIEVNAYDFVDENSSQATPYGIYDIQDNRGYVNVGISSNTAEFAVESIRQWWRNTGITKYKESKKILICADCGGSNGYRVRLWKYELQKLADEIGLDITVCHFPPGTSKWNKIEHRLFSHITKNWRGKPLLTYSVIINLISATTTKKGLIVESRLDTNIYPKKIKVTKEQFESIKITTHKFHGEWNYDINKK